jgi:hypothetical protein
MRDPRRQICLTSLPFEADGEAVQLLLTRAGIRVLDVRVPEHRERPGNMGVAFLSFETVEARDRAFDAMLEQPLELYGRVLRPQDVRPPRTAA